MRPHSKTSWTSRGWGGFWWTRWIPVDKLTSVSCREGFVPELASVYRIRTHCPLRLAYVGESGNLAVRVMGNWYLAGDTDSSSASGDAALQHVHRWLERTGDDSCEISWVLQCPRWSNGLRDKQERRACERYFTWLYRLETGRSAFANHGRATRGGNRRIDYDEEQGDEHWRWRPDPIRPSRRPLLDEGLPPYAAGWMNGSWTPLMSHREIKRGGWYQEVPQFRLERLNPGIYKVLDPALNQVLQVGYRSKMRKGILRVLREVPGQPVAAWWALPEGTFEYQCRELADDIVGACYARYGRALRHGFPDS